MKAGYILATLLFAVTTFTATESGKLHKQFGYASIPRIESTDSTNAESFDFWVGEWEVFNAKNQPAGDSRIEKILKDAVILENWTGRTGYTGKSFNHFDPNSKKWYQYWIDEKAVVVSFEGSYDAEQKAIVFLSYDHQEDETYPFLRRLRFFDVDSDNVRQFSERSYDGGVTWATEYDLYYKRKK